MKVFLSILLALVASPVSAGEPIRCPLAMPSAVEKELVPVLEALAIADKKHNRWDSDYTAALDRLYRAKGPAASEARIALMDYFIGANASDNLLCAIASDGSRVKYLLELYSRCDIAPSSSLATRDRDQVMHLRDRALKLIKEGHLKDACSPFPTGVHHLNNVERNVLLHPQAFVLLDRVGLLPPSVREAFARSLKQASFSMANPDEKYQVTDVIVEEGLPDRRLIFAAKSKDYVLLSYEQGGIGHGYHVLLFKISGSTARMAWRAASYDKTSTLAELGSAIRQDKMDDLPAIYW